jgi:hypothetical protein
MTTTTTTPPPFSSFKRILGFGMKKNVIQYEIVIAERIFTPDRSAALT